jgi:tRNA pseudouridine38-40 synthase
MRVVLGIEYDGTDFYGWQMQKDGRSVQSCLDEALSAVADTPIRVTGAGRTDTGVHATGQVAHFDTEVERPDRAWTLGVNTALPPDIVVRWVRRAPPDFHARYSARRRSYQFCIFNGPIRSALLRHRTWWVRRPLDADAMHAAAQALVGEHDFSAFRASQCQAHSAVRSLERLTVRRDGPLIRIDVTANAFLHHMVRNIAGTLAMVGRGEAGPGWVESVLAGRDRRKAGMTAPPSGLCLTRVDYGGVLGQPPAVAPLAMGIASETE